MASLLIRSCLPEHLCDADDVMLIDEIGREWTGQPPTPILPPRTLNEEVTVRLLAVQGMFQNRLLSTFEQHEQASFLKGVRLVAAILKDSEIISASTPSEPLRCRFSGKHIDFDASWGHGGGFLSFDHSSSDSQYNDNESSLEIVLALLHESNDATSPTSNEFHVVCPCGETMFRLKRNSNRHDLSITGRPSPRNFVLFPRFRGTEVEQVRRRQSATFEEKKCKSVRDGAGMDLPYLSLEKGTLSVEVSWKEKEPDVEVFYGGESSSDSFTESNHSETLPTTQPPSSQQILIDSKPGGYSFHRFPKDEYESPVNSTDEHERDEESYISLKVRPISPVLAVPQDPEREEGDDEPGNRADILEDVMRALDIEFSAADAADSRPPKSASSVGANPLSDDKVEGNNTHEIPQSSPSHAPKAVARSVSEIHSATAPKERPTLTRPLSESQLSPKSKRNWSSAFRKQHSNKSSSSLKHLDESVLKELSITMDDQNGVRKRAANEKVEGTKQSPSSSKQKNSPPRKGLFSGFRSKSTSDRRQNKTSPEEEALYSRQLTQDEVRQLENQPSLLSDLGDDEDEEGAASPKSPNGAESLALAPSPARTADNDTVGAIRLLDSFCSTGEEVWMDEEEEVALTPPRPAARRDISHLSKDSQEGGVTWVSHESASDEAFQLQKPAKMTMQGGGLLVPHALCTSLSDVTMDHSVGRVRSLEKPKSFGRYLSMESNQTEKSAKSEITALSKIEDRMIMKAYHACGGRHLDFVTDAILGLHWLDSSEKRVAKEMQGNASVDEESVFSLANVDFQRAITSASQALDRQLTTITEESETRGGLHATSTLTDIPDGALETIAEPPAPSPSLVRLSQIMSKASF